MKKLLLILAMCCICLFCTAQVYPEYSYPEYTYNEYQIDYVIEDYSLNEFSLDYTNPLLENPFNVGYDNDVIFHSIHHNYELQENMELLINLWLWEAIENYENPKPDPVINIEITIKNPFIID